MRIQFSTLGSPRTESWNPVHAGALALLIALAFAASAHDGAHQGMHASVGHFAHASSQGHTSLGHASLGHATPWRGGAAAGTRSVAWHGGGGHWNHGWHDGRWGWWWFNAGIWNWYAYDPYYLDWPYGPYAYYGYPPAARYYPPAEPAPNYSDLPPPAPTWYYCDAAKGYYPYVSNCPGGWRAVAATPPAPQTAPTPPDAPR